jgi:hypothetical protein
VLSNPAGVTFQWAFNGTDIVGEIGDSLLLPAVTAANTGEYSVTATNSAGTVTSAAAMLALDSGTGPPPRPRLVAYSDVGGSVTVTPLRRDYDLGEPVTLTAAASPPGVFVGWSGIITGDLLPTTNPVTVRVPAGDTTVRARFATPMPLPQGMVAFWRGETDAADPVGGYSGTFYTGSTPTVPGVTQWGKVGGAFAFGGMVYVQVPDAPGLRPPQVTLEAWVYPTVLGGSYQTVIGRGSSASTDETWWLGLLNGVPQFFSHGSVLLAGPAAVPVNAWTHLAATFDGSAKVLYVNGVPVASQGGLGPLAYDPAPVPVTIGAAWQNNAPADLFTGLLDEISLYNRALTPGEVSSIAAAGPAGKITVGPYITTDPQLPAAIVSQPYTQAFTSVRGTAPVSYVLSAASVAPPGLTLTPAGVLSGTPTATGAFNFTVVATDAAGLSGEQSCELQAYQSVTAPAGIIGWWKAEGNALDSAGANNGVLQGGAGFTAGEVGQAFALDGVAGCVEIPDAPGLRPASFTLEAWVLFDSISGLRTVFAKPVDIGTNDSYTLWLNSGTLTGIICDATSAGAQLAAPEPLTTGTWYHVAYTVDDTARQQALYVNGVQVASGATTLSAGYDTQPLLLGRDTENGAPDYFLQGNIDEAAIYNRALTSAEIASIYNAGSAGKTL